MPYRTEYVDADEYLTHRDVTVYYTYRDDDYEQSTNAYIFSLCPEDGPEGDAAFDVRHLRTWTEPGVHQRFGQAWDAHIRAAIKKAIDSGELTQDGCNPDVEPEPEEVCV